MPQVGIQGLPDWNEIFGGLAQSFDPQRALRARLMGEQAAMNRMKMQQLQTTMDAAAEAERTNREYWAAQQPPEQTAGVSVGEGTPWAVDTTTSFYETDPAKIANFDLLRKKQMSLFNLGARNATSFADVAKGAPMVDAQTRAALYGAPTTKAGRDLAQMQLEQTVPGTLDEAKIPVKNMVPVDATGRPAGAPIATRDGITDLQGNPIRLPAGQTLALASPVSPEATNVYQNEGAMRQELARLATKARTEGLTIDETQRAGIMLDTLFPKTRTTQMVGKQLVPVETQTPIPGEFTGIAGLRDDYRANRHLQATTPPAPPTTGAVPFVDPLGNPQATPPSAPSNMPLPTAPVVPTSRPEGGITVGAPIASAPGDVVELMNKFQQMQPVKTYTSALGPWQSLVANMKVNSAAADVGIIYAAAKILDPDSVVREGEQIMFTRGAQGRLDYLNGYLARALAGQPALTTAARRDIAQMLTGAMNGHYSNYAPFATNFREIAKEQGVNPDRVVTLGEPPQIDLGTINTVPAARGMVAPVPGVLPRTAPGASTAAPATAAPAAPTAPGIDWNYLRRFAP